MMRILLSLCAAVGLTVGVGAVLAEAEEATSQKPCSHAEQVVKPGESVEVDGKQLTCDGATGTLVEAEAEAKSEQ